MDADVAPNRDPGTRFLWRDTVTVFFAGVVGSVLFGGVLIALLYGFEEDSIDPAAQFWILLPAQSVAQIAAVVWVSRRRGTGSIARDFAFDIEPRHLGWVAAGPAALFGLGVLAAGVRAALGVPEENPQELLDAVAGFRNSVTALAIVVGVVVLGPVAEELTFRGLLFQTGIDKGLSTTQATLISAAAFSVIHLVDTSLASLAGSVTLLVLFALGVILAQIRLRTRSLGPAIFTHSGFNLTTIVALFFFVENGV